MWEQQQEIKAPKITIGHLIDEIQFSKPKAKKKGQMSETDTISLSSCHSLENKEKSKVWSEEEEEMFYGLLKKYGTDFTILSTFFPKKSKNQLKVQRYLIKNKYKQKSLREKKKDKEEGAKLRAMRLLFKEVDEKEEDN